MEVRISVEKILTEESGVSKSGNSWRKLQFIGQTFDQYPKHIAFTLMNDNIDKFRPFLQVAADLNVSFDLSSRDWTDSHGNTRWSTEVTAWKVDYAAVIQPSPETQPQPQPVSATSPQPQPNYDAQAAAYFAQQPSPQSMAPQPDGDLPF